MRTRSPGWTTWLPIAVVITTILFVGRSVPAQTAEPTKESPEVQQLKERLRQLEETVNALKGQITTIETVQKTASTTAASNPVRMMDAVATGDAVLTNPAAPDTSKPAVKRLGNDASDTTFDIYGFAMLDAGYQFKQNHPDWYDTLRPTKLPAFKDEFRPDGKTYWGVRQSRLGFKTSTPTKYGELKTIFEFELFGTGVDAGQTTFRLRHAYGELGKFGAGQYWTVFGDVDTFPNTIEYWGPPGLIWYRNVQVRYMPLKGKNSVTIALERPGASGDQGVYANRIELSGIKPKFAWPDLTGNVRWDRDWGHVQVAGILRSIRWIDTNDADRIDFGGSAVGYGGSLSSALNFGKNDVGRFQVTYGTGIQNYFNDAPVDIGPENRIVPATGLGGTTLAPVKGVALPIFGMSAFLDHRWNERFTSAGGFSMVNIENSDAQTASSYHRGMYAIGNLLYSPIPNVTVGGEFQWGNRKNFADGFTSYDTRIQFVFKYNFSRTFKL